MLAEAGKYYLTKGNCLVGPLVPDKWWNGCYWHDTSMKFTETGVCSLGSHHDLQTEIPESLVPTMRAVLAGNREYADVPLPAMFVGGPMDGVPLLVPQDRLVVNAPSSDEYGNGIDSEIYHLETINVDDEVIRLFRWDGMSRSGMLKALFMNYRPEVKTA